MHRSNTLRTEELDYHLPEDRIATRPVHPRDAARMMVVSRADAQRLEHRHVRDLPELLLPDDLLVFNTTRVLPAAFSGVREDTGGKVQGLYLRPGPAEGTWLCLLKARRFRVGAVVRIAGPDERAVRLTLVARAGAEPGAWVVRVEDGSGPVDQARTPAVLERIGRPPLPPYILAARKRHGEPAAAPDDADRYQTVYADRPGSVAAPTAGLHFTPELLDRLAARGVERADVVLHVGTGTFKPIETETIQQHRMHTEWCSMPPETAAAILARVGRLSEPPQSRVDRLSEQAGGRVIAVGTTAVRTIESYAGLAEDLVVRHGVAGHPPARRAGPPEVAAYPQTLPPSLETDLLIAPGFEWKWTDGLLTNFHLPRSTLLALVAAFLPGGIDRVKELYAGAIREGYRFYSYGDAMLILP